MRTRLFGPPRDDDGFSLMEVMVGSAIMSVVMALATAGFMSMFRTTDRTEAAAQTQTSLLAAFSKLDRDVRYAFRVYAPGVADDRYYVDYVIPDDANKQQCVRLSLPVGGGTLVRRQWSPGGSDTTSTVAADLAPSTAGTNPFTLVPSGDAISNFERLGVRLTSTVGLTGIGRSRDYDLQFTALNTIKVGPDDNVLRCAP